ncbi:multidrug efflux MFS transporter [Streptacidiphilus sp. PB12-B1b]|uniref:DHA2 family efflux MFS transporter permease subunit n=1 Tax=Streptacidiphilus sp. PB12-B1b TaxID=2705012 RepID=UPI0015F7CB7A|nr:DHA2 family efflux MFS transporter permease subunit [Streptacidiphilus sp. PB12-B1b]QMU76187.1 multidrug efflux MFS transporter [Streptacidiphilus sp. PB12-B1b]
MVASTIFLSIVDGAITTVALPSIGSQFHLAPTGLDSVVVVYPVCVGMTMPASAWLGDRFGGKRVLLLALALFTLASALCGSADGLGQLVAYRALQGCAGGLLLPVGSTMLFRTFSASERVRAGRLMIFPQQVAPALAPILGGILVTSFSWRWVFYVNLPVGAAATLFGLLFLTPHRDHEPDRLDVPGLVLSAAGLASLMYGVCEGAQQGWSAPAVDAALAGGVALLAAATAVQLRTREPVLRLRLFADRLFRDTNLICLVGLVAIMGAMFLGPLFIQEAQGRSALASGTSTFTEAFGVVLTVQVAGALYARVGPRLIIAAGMGGVAVVLLLLSGCGLHTSLWTIRLYMFLLGVSMGGVFMPTTVASLSTVDRADVGHASTLNTVVRQTAGALAPAVVATLLVLESNRPAGAPPQLAAYQDAYRGLALIALAAALFSLTMPDAAARRAALGEPEPNAAADLPEQRASEPQAVTPPPGAAS